LNIVLFFSHQNNKPIFFSCWS